MGQAGSCFSPILSPCWRTYRRKRDLVSFFNVASESEISERFNFLPESFVTDLIVRRQILPFRSLRDVCYLRNMKYRLLSECKGSLQNGHVTVITERRPSVNPYQGTFNILGSHSFQLSLQSTSDRNLPPKELFPDSLISLLKRTELIDSWNVYCSTPLSNGVASTAQKFRIASWNLERFTSPKARHPGFREAICLLLLRNNIDLITFQEVSDVDAISELASELNSPTLPNVRHWSEEVCGDKKSGQTVWSAIVSSEPTGKNFQGREFSAFLFRENRFTKLSSGILGRTSSPEKRTGKSFARDPFMGKFRLSSHTMVLASVHLKAAGLGDNHVGRTFEEISNLATFVDAINETFSENAHYIILGDFNMDPGHEAFGPLRDRGLTNVIPTGKPTMVKAAEKQPLRPNSSGDTNVSRSSSTCCSCFDNAWLSKSLTTSSVATPIGSGLQFTNEAGVFLKDIRHPLIPSLDRAGFNGSVSDHCPIYFDLVLV